MMGGAAAKFDEAVEIPSLKSKAVASENLGPRPSFPTTVMPGIVMPPQGVPIWLWAYIIKGYPGVVVYDGGCPGCEWEEKVKR
jgi:hypothetical protein